MTRQSASCDTCRQRRVKCDGVKPVCGRCFKSDRQCQGFDDSNRLILKDETLATKERVEKKPKKRARSKNACNDTTGPSTRSGSPAAGQTNSTLPVIHGSSRGESINLRRFDDMSEWFPPLITTTARITPFHERDQVALHCCRETISVRTLSWVMSDEKWIQLLPYMMSRSESLASVIHANAATYLAKAQGARNTTIQALTHYVHALEGLQQDLYDPVRQKSDETLFAIILLGVFDIHNNQDLGSWQAHVRGATRIIQCNGSEYYKQPDSPSRVLAKYVRGFDIILAMSNQEETIFGEKDWDHLGEGSFVRPLDSLLTHYGHITNTIANAEKLRAPTIEQMDDLFDELEKSKKALKDWKKDLPVYYKPFLVPTSNLLTDEDSDSIVPYPYDERLDYVTNFIGHTMNMYKAAILRIDRYLLGQPLSKPSPTEIHLAKKIVKSFPSLSVVGGIFILYPAMRAAKVLSTPEKQYIISTLQKISTEVPVAARLAAHIMEFEMGPPTEDMCRTPLGKVWGPYWDLKGKFLGTRMGS